MFLFSVEAIKQGKVSEQTVRERVSPLFYTRMRLGEFDPSSMNPYSTLSSADVETPAHKQLALQAAMKSFVLLKNDGLLPLSGPFKTIGVRNSFSNIHFFKLSSLFWVSVAFELTTTPQDEIYNKK